MIDVFKVSDDGFGWLFLGYNLKVNGKQCIFTIAAKPRYYMVGWCGVSLELQLDRTPIIKELMGVTCVEGDGLIYSQTGICVFGGS